MIYAMVPHGEDERARTGLDKAHLREHPSIQALMSSRLAITMLVVVMLLVLTGVLAPWIVPYDPLKIYMGDPLLPPSRTHWFGTDEVGRDIFSRVIMGIRISLRVPIVVIGLASLIGTSLGAVAGYVSGRVDEVVMRVTDVFLAFPGLLIAMAVAAALGPSLTNAMLAISLVWWPSYARLVRGLVLSIKNNPYVEAARCIGASDSRILFRHVLPECIPVISVKMTVDAGYSILWTASLSFIGLGAQPPTPEWGTMVAYARPYLLKQWWYPTFPGLMIFVVVICFALLGDGLETVFEPKLRKR